MSRLKKFTRSLLSGYVTLGANIFYTLASVPLALHYLSKAEFGLWALVSSISGYIALIDLGMSSSVARILIDHKDDRRDGAYGGVIQVGALVGLVQGAIVVVAGIALSTLAGSLLRVPDELRHEFVWLMIGQSTLLGLTFATKIFGQLLYAHQRLDVSNHSASVLFFINLAVMWAGFAGGLGIYGFLIGQVVMTIGSVTVSALACVRLGLLPHAGEWGQVTKKRFNEMFAFGQGVFLISVGIQFINTSQTILLTSLLGLETVATWTVCTRAYTMLTMLVWRILDYSAPALSEMVVRGEREKVLGRLRDITVLMAGFSVLGGTLFAMCNGPFVQIWMMGKINWPQVNNVWLALWFFACSVMRVHTGLVGITKNLRFLRFIYLVEGLVFIGLNLLAWRIESMTWMLIFSLASTLAFTLPYGLWRTQKYFGMSWRELLGWLQPTWQLAWRLVPIAWAVWWLARGLPPKWQLTVNLVLPSLTGTVILLRYGLDKTLQTEIAEKLPPSTQRAFKRLVRA